MFLEDALRALHAQMAQALDAQEWEQLQELDRQARALLERAFGAEPVPLRDDSGGALRQLVEEFSHFYETSLHELSQQRGELTRQIRELKSGRKATRVYETTRRHSMGPDGGYPEG